MLSTPFPWARKGLTKEGIQNSLEEGRYTEVNKSLSGRYTTAQAAQGKVGQPLPSLKLYGEPDHPSNELPSTVRVGNPARRKEGGAGQ